jgi:hypothetical protein
MKRAAFSNLDQGASERIIQNTTHDHDSSNKVVGIERVAGMHVNDSIRSGASRLLKGEVCFQGAIIEYNVRIVKPWVWISQSFQS